MENIFLSVLQYFPWWRENWISFLLIIEKHTRSAWLKFSIKNVGRRNGHKRDLPQLRFSFWVMNEGVKTRFWCRCHWKYLVWLPNYILGKKLGGKNPTFFTHKNFLLEISIKRNFLCPLNSKCALIFFCADHVKKWRLPLTLIPFFFSPGLPTSSHFSLSPPNLPKALIWINPTARLPCGSAAVNVPGIHNHPKSREKPFGNKAEWGIFPVLAGIQISGMICNSYLCWGFLTGWDCVLGS